MITLLITSFIAGVLTILTPCALPLLPIILGGSLQNKSKIRPFIIIASLAVSVLLFTFTIKAGFFVLGFDDSILRILSGLIILILGVFTFFPNAWTTIMIKLGVEQASSQALVDSNKKSGVVSAILTGLALGPVFTTCSPLFGYILFAILPASFAEGTFYILMFVLGMSLFLLLIALAGQSIIKRAKWAADPSGKFKKVLGVIFIVVGIMIIFKVDKQIESFLLDQPFIQSILVNRLEQDFINTLQP